MTQYMPRVSRRLSSMLLIPYEVIHNISKLSLLLRGFNYFILILNFMNGENLITLFRLTNFTNEGNSIEAIE